MKPIALLPVIASLLLLASCSGGDRSPLQTPTANPAATPTAGPAGAVGTLDPQDTIDPELAEVIHPDGMAEGSLGVFWLVRDPVDPLVAHLEMARYGAAQGDLYALSIRPFLSAANLSVVGSAAGPNATTDYTMRFVHPYSIPADFNPPATSTKRMDLFIFDVNLLLCVSGSDSFFANSIKTNWGVMPNASGFRQAGPLFSPASLGVSNGTNVFPYQLVGNIN
ncbi:MAG: hypothetical protein ABI743_02795, partial [bacterium]